MSSNRIPKQVTRTRMAQTGETYQQALVAIRAQVPATHLAVPDDGPCVGRCLSVFLANDADGQDGGSMLDCACCPGLVCVYCGRANVAEPYGQCDSCTDALDELAREQRRHDRDQRLAARCAGRLCISEARAGVSDRDSATFYCHTCGEPICFCGQRPVENPLDFCNSCDVYEKGWEERSREEYRRQLVEQLEYQVGLVVKLGGGRYRDVRRTLVKQLSVRDPADAEAEELEQAVHDANCWIQRLREG